MNKNLQKKIPGNPLRCATENKSGIDRGDVFERCGGVPRGANAQGAHSYLSKGGSMLTYSEGSRNWEEVGVCGNAEE